MVSDKNIPTPSWTERSDHPWRGVDLPLGCIVHLCGHLCWCFCCICHHCLWWFFCLVKFHIDTPPHIFTSPNNNNQSINCDPDHHSPKNDDFLIPGPLSLSLSLLDLCISPQPLSLLVTCITLTWQWFCLSLKLTPLTIYITPPPSSLYLISTLSYILAFSILFLNILWVT